MLKLARWSTTHRKYVILGWIVLLRRRQRARAVRRHELLQQLHAAQLRHPAGVGSAAKELPGAGRRPRPDRLQGRHGTVNDPAVRARMSAMFAAVDKLPHVTAVISPYGGAVSGRAISATEGSRSRPSCSTKKPTCCPKPRRNASSRSHERRRGRGSEVAARRPGDREDRAARLRDLDGGRTARGDRRAAADLRLADRDGHADRDGPLRPRHRARAIALFTHVVNTPNFSSELAAMIGLGVGIDYALFILHPLPRGLPHPGRTFDDVRESVAEVDRHGRARGAVRRLDRRDRPAGHDAARGRLPVRRGDLRPRSGCCS